MDATPSEAFRFVAVRPAQLASDDDAKIVVVRNPRAAKPDGLRHLIAAAESIASPARALRRWQQIDLAPFAALAAARLELLADYAAVDPPPAVAFVGAAGLQGVDPADDGLIARLWDIL